MQRYKIRLHESGERDGSISEGTIVLHLGGGNTVEAASIEEAESRLRAQVANGKLYRGRVYQICPPLGNGESQRTLAVSLAGAWLPCRLENADRLYAGFKRIRMDVGACAPNSAANDAPAAASQPDRAIPAGVS